MMLANVVSELFFGRQRSHIRLPILLEIAKAPFLIFSMILKVMQIYTRDFALKATDICQNIQSVTDVESLIGTVDIFGIIEYAVVLISD